LRGGSTSYDDLREGARVDSDLDVSSKVGRQVTNDETTLLGLLVSNVNNNVARDGAIELRIDRAGGSGTRNSSGGSEEINLAGSDSRNADTVVVVVAVGGVTGNNPQVIGSLVRVPVSQSLTDIDEQGVGHLVRTREGELSIDRVNHGLSQDWGTRELGIKSAELEWDDGVSVSRDARIGSWLTASRSGPAGFAGTNLVRASSLEVTVGWAVAEALLWDNVSRVQLVQQLLSLAIRSRDGSRVVGDTELSNTAEIATISGIRTPEVGASRLELSDEGSFDTFARIGGISWDSGSSLRGLEGRNNLVGTPTEGLTLDKMSPTLNSPLVTRENGVVTAASGVRLLPLVSVPVASIADLRTNPPTPAVHEGIVASQGSSRAGQDGWEVLDTTSGLHVTHRFRERRVVEVVLVLLGRDETALGRGLSASITVQSVLEVQETTILSDGDPTILGGLDKKGLVTNGKGRTIFVDDTRAGGETSPSSPGLLGNKKGTLGVGRDTEAVVKRGLDGGFDDTSVGPLLVESKVSGTVLLNVASKGLGETIDDGVVDNGISGRTSGNIDGTSLVAENISDTSAGEGLLEDTGAVTRGQSGAGKGLSGETSDSRGFSTDFVKGP